MPGGMSGKKQNLSVGLSVCSGQTGRWISLKLGMMIGFDPNLKYGPQKVAKLLPW